MNVKTLYYPERLRQRKIWVLWRLEARDGRRTKVPYQTNGRRASCADPSHWTSYTEAAMAWLNDPDRYQGLGIAVSKADRLVFIDIDHCVDPYRNLDDRAVDILEAFRGDDGRIGTFAEFSQSGTGLHIFAFGEIPRSFKNSQKNVEMYSGGRFAAMTGHPLIERDPEECEHALWYVFEHYKTAPLLPAPDTLPAAPVTHREDDWIIRHASARDRSKFSSLFGGDWSGFGSRSEADMALCCLLAFWTDKDPAAMDRIFRRSGLYRAKWERPDYRDRTIKNAIARVSDTLSGFIGRNDKERGLASVDELYTVGR